MEKTNEINPITEGNLFQAIVKYFMPIFFGSIIQQSYSIIDALIIGNYAGKEALAAIDSTWAVTALFIRAFIAVAAGGSVIIAQHYGGRRFLELEKTIKTLTLFSLLGGILITVIGVGMTGELVKIMEVPQDIFVQSRDYLRIYFLGTIFSLGYNINGGIIRAMGDSKRPFIFLSIASLVNIVLDLILVAGFGMGVIGAALGTLIAQGLAAALTWVYMAREKLPVKISFKNMKIEKDVLKQILKLGIPMGVQSALYSISNMYMQTSINTFGIDGIAAWAICGKLDFLIWTIADTLAITVITFVAQNYGAKKLPRMDKVFRYGLVIGLVTLGTISSILYFGGSYLSQGFTRDAQVIKICHDILKTIAPFYVVFGFGEVIASAIKGRGETFKPMLITLIGTCFFRIFWVAIIVKANPSLELTIYGYPVSWVLTTSILVFYYIIYKMKVKT